LEYIVQIITYVKTDTDNTYYLVIFMRKKKLTMTIRYTINIDYMVIHYIYIVIND